MSAAKQIEWLSLIESTGPFLAISVLDQAMPQGLDTVIPFQRKRIRSAYEEWCEAVDEADPRLEDFHREWIRLVIEELLEYDVSVLKGADEVSDALSYQHLQTSDSIHPDFVVTSGEKPKLFFATYPPDTDLTSPLDGEPWSASPLERMTLICRAKEVPVGIVTNGERWTLVGALPDGTTSYGSWFARIWLQEPITLQAFQTLLGVRRCFGPETETLEALFTESLKHRDEVTDTLGEQVRRAIEVLVQALDRADLDRDRQLLKDVSPKDLYDAGLTVMMRLVFVLCAEERKLLLLGEQTYDQHYAVSTLRSQLLADAEHHGLEVLERRHDAWSRLLAVFRGVFAGIEHDDLRLPALGGSLFEPDKYPFLEGRAAGTTWEEIPAVPLPIDNRTVLMLLSALQVLEVSSGAQHLSYEALDVEQIGHVYEGLLERTAQRVPEATLGLIGTAKFVNPNLALRELEDAAEAGEDALIALIHENTGRSESAVRNAAKKDVPQKLRDRLLSACGGDQELSQRILPFANHLRTDNWDDPLVYRKKAFIVALGAGRRETGTHYTPKSLTEPIVQDTLEPLVYVGPAEGKPQSEWKLKSPAEILEMKVCDMAMGSGAFLVQACRWMGDRLVEAWDAEEKAGQVVSLEGVVLEQPDDSELLPADQGERILIARRLVSSRCLYGVDINPMAVELAKLSLWLVTLMKNRPFGFLDHALKCGDSLLGVSSIQQIENFSLRPGERQGTFATAHLSQAVRKASAKRRALEELPSNDNSQIETKNQLHGEAEDEAAIVKAVADCLIAFELRGLGGDAYEDQRTYEAEKVQQLMKSDADTSKSSQAPSIDQLRAHAHKQLRHRRPFHWSVEFSEVFSRGGFDAFFGNPPYMHGRRISTNFSSEYLQFLSKYHSKVNASADLVTYFLLRAFNLLRPKGVLSLIATQGIATGDSRETGLQWVKSNGGCIIRSEPDFAWPGTAAVRVCSFTIWKECEPPFRIIGGKKVANISSFLREENDEAQPPMNLALNKPKASTGTYVYGKGFVVSQKMYLDFLASDSKNGERLFPFLRGMDINRDPEHRPSAWVINFDDMDRHEAEQWPHLFRHLEETVESERAKQTKQVHEACFWKHWDKRPELYEKLRDIERCIVHAFTSKHVAFALVPSNQIFATPHIVFPIDCAGFFAVCQSTLHVEWVNKYSSKMKSDIRYTPSDCVQTFPFPDSYKSLKDVGGQYLEHRTKIMTSNEEGLTKVYNRLHDPSDESEEIQILRKCQSEVDYAVASAYGWEDIDLGHMIRKTPRGFRYTFSENALTEISARLLALNHQRYTEEVAAGLHEKKAKKKSASRKRAKKKSTSKDNNQPDLL